MRNRLLIAALALAAALQSAPTPKATLTGKVTDSTGHLLQNATVMIFEAGVKKGYSTYCPTCYVDCGKRATTDQTGAFTFTNLDPDLWFNLLVIRDGYNATFINKVDPAQQPAATAALTQRAPVNDPTRLVRGRIIDPAGQPMRAAVVMPRGLETAEGSMYGTSLPGLEPIAVTNERGEFELADSDKAVGILLKVEARGMATKLVAAPTGPDRKNHNRFRRRNSSRTSRKPGQTRSRSRTRPECARTRRLRRAPQSDRQPLRRNPHRDPAGWNVRNNQRAGLRRLVRVRQDGAKRKLFTKFRYTLRPLKRWRGRPKATRVRCRMLARCGCAF